MWLLIPPAACTICIAKRTFANKRGRKQRHQAEVQIVCLLRSFKGLLNVPSRLAAAGPLTAIMQSEPSVLVRLAAIEAALATRSGLVRYKLATGGSLALILEQWLLWAQRWVAGCSVVKHGCSRGTLGPVLVL